MNFTVDEVVGLLALLAQFGALVWAGGRISQKLDMIGKAFSDHVKSDEENFARLHEKTSENAEELARIGGRVSAATVGSLTRA